MVTGTYSLIYILIILISDIVIYIDNKCNFMCTLTVYLYGLFYENKILLFPLQPTRYMMDSSITEGIM